ncbi:MAG TPA: PTS sugar transporter subunit IIA [Gemmatimonadales bacterium]|nr:PTS sugar transporter subunit IIA [Gemmatimonadales bacterium]
MRLRDFLAEDAIALSLAGETKDAILQELVALLRVDERSAATLHRVLQRREALGSTGVGHGIAIPHGRSLVVDRLRLAFGRHLAGVEWEAMDGKPVFHFFLIVAPPLEVSNQYLPVLGRIAQFAKDADVNQRLMGLRTPGELLALFDERGV